MCHQPRCGWPCRPSQWGLSPNPQRAGSHKHPTPLPQPPSSPVPSWFPIFFPDVGTTGPMISLGTQAALPAPWGCAGALGHWNWWLETLSGTRKIGKNSEFCFLRAELRAWTAGPSAVFGSPVEPRPAPLVSLAKPLASPGWSRPRCPPQRRKCLRERFQNTKRKHLQYLLKSRWKLPALPLARSHRLF